MTRSCSVRFAFSPAFGSMGMACRVWAALVPLMFGAVLLGGCASIPQNCQFLTCADRGQWRVDIVPESAITAYGQENVGDSPSEFGSPAVDKGSLPDAVTADVFPSLPVGAESSDKVEPQRVDGFFLPGRPFGVADFAWRAASQQASEIHIHVEQAGTSALLSVAPADLKLMRQLNWVGFQRMQTAFSGFIAASNGCWFVSSCEAKLGPGFRRNLRDFWRQDVLPYARLPKFVTRLLSQDIETIQYAKPEHDPDPDQRNTIKPDRTRMVVSAIEPQELLTITWGVDSIYLPNEEGAIRYGYSRSVPGGRTTIKVTRDAAGWASLFPRHACGADSWLQAASGSEPTEALLPYPAAWGALLQNTFVPVYNLFDLHNPTLFADKARGGGNHCWDAHQYAQRLFLLAPMEYIKADKADKAGTSRSIRQFENESRSVYGPKDPVSQNPEEQLARQFLIIGCGAKASVHDVQLEWNKLLENAHQQVPLANPAGSDELLCARYVHAAFGAKAYVELLETLSINGQAVEGGVPRGETLGGVIAAYWSTHHEEQTSDPSMAAVKLVRSTASIPGIGRIVLRFHTRDPAVLGEIVVRQGDAIWAVSVPEAVW